MRSNCKGNVLVYILLAVALFAALTYAVSGENRGSQQNQLTESQVDLLATSLIAQATTVKQTISLMEQWGIEYNDLMFDLPGSASYTSNVSRQVYHPSGGGLSIFNEKESYKAMPSARGWTWQNLNNVEWSATTDTDLIYTFLDISENVCAKINERLHNDPAIPISTVNYIDVFMTNSPNPDFLITDCPECQGIDSLCISNSTNYAFYNIIGMR